MRLRPRLLAASLAALCALPATAAPPRETADQFAARVNATFAEHFEEGTSAAWLSQTYINDDTARIASLVSERGLGRLNALVEEARRFEGQPMSAASARTLALLKLSTAMPAPRDPARLRELATIATRLDQAYGAGQWCRGEGPAKVCQNIGQISQTLASNRDYEAQLEAWEGWHTISVPMRRDYVRFVELTNEGARAMGYADTGAMWRSGYDMPADTFAAETDRLWDQVRPLYEQLQCYTREKLVERYGRERGQVDGMIPAHLTGNLWQQDWSNLWELLQPYPKAAKLDVTATLERQHRERVEKALAALKDPTPAQQAEAERQAAMETAIAMTRLAESFYTGLGMPALPESFYEKSQFLRPRDREVVCHASAWQMNPDASDVRMKMCIEPNETDLTTIYHELGHIYYYLAYKDQPLSFQTGAHDGFHEAIGDTIVLSMTPKYLQSVGLVGEAEVSREATINAQMRMALAKVAFMPFGLLIDRWRWGVFDGSIPPERYNSAWWELKAKYQGVAPATPRGEDFFDPGAKYHVPGNTPYTRYFLSHVLQFQFYKALCDAAGHTGPLHECSFAGNPEAGRRYWAMMQAGASQPWQKTLKELTGGERMDASAVLEYFAPLKAWLEEQNRGKACGWPAR
ncbi:M2 family metallopeptidase [Silanimonas lenta]|uniref:M2 family metallopeptidase n=1 Tax=Silanimonas lenta TaxID=265429 RepID=UPI002FE23FA7